ncbi:hypothetical protein [Amycolatopsis saalfeldensis]|uniref:Uncharacterized protein n=1 Tax=Amycolatopsis saalfeldensis TaxID=394193 RepID=A0A1H8YL93_9PSEU|nr:hypothetical protein [Amycolatopsis saalfeldensis]SEP52188.1 hypothetical protein SAMN04489732_11970 [Amycolatopsis saalfeldensis]
MTEPKDPERLLADALRAQAVFAPHTSPGLPREDPEPADGGTGAVASVPDEGTGNGGSTGTTPVEGSGSGSATGTGPTAELPPRYGLLSGASADSLERERAALDWADGTTSSGTTGQGSGYAGASGSYPSQPSGSYPANGGYAPGSGHAGAAYASGGSGAGYTSGGSGQTGASYASGSSGQTSSGYASGSSNQAGAGYASGGNAQAGAGYGQAGYASGNGGGQPASGYPAGAATPHAPSLSPDAATVRQTPAPASTPLPVHWVLLLALLLGLAAGSVIGLLTLV